MNENMQRILDKIKEDNNFALLQPIGVDENGTNGVKCILIHILKKRDNSKVSD